ncbi:transglutaminase-like domain-containing protein [Cereibacter changlensis]|uniref:Transglutaminase n=2 Tax=Cereibacter changlensis TaxID=402884 RepID=A0A2T4JRM6_9RHOB|nr:transglutaminase family protein [Cereibacter changlensis]PTE20447.1 transglutaminase [Cereibacter changlensis JA139]PZX55163.1 transglutaminase-like putative cysteine protease [Cereibacter changlensis]
MLIRFGYEISVNCQQPTPMISLLALRDERLSDLRMPDTVMTRPEVPTSIYRDLFGNTCRRFVAPAGDLTLTADGVIADSGLTDPVDWSAQETPIANLPDDTLVYLLGSRYCETDRLSQLAWDMFGHIAPGWGRVQAICDFVHNHIRFDYQNARNTRTAYEAWQEGTGVCRDFTHLGIALCRCMNIPARYINGYLGDIGVPVVLPMDFSAWMEVYVGGRWMTFDPRNNQPRIGRIVVARGRDAADVPLLHSFGPHMLTGFKVWCEEVQALPAEGSPHP